MATGSVSYIDNITSKTAEAYYSLSGVSTGYFNIQKNGTGTAKSYSITSSGYYLYLSGLSPNTQYKTYLSWYESGVQKFSSAYWFTTSESVEGYASVVCGTGCNRFSYAYVHNGIRYSGTSYDTKTEQCDHFWIENVYPDSGYALPWSYTQSGQGTFSISGSTSSNYANATISPTYDYSSTDAKTITISFSQLNTYYLTLYGNGGTWSGSTYLSDYVSIASSSYTFDLTSYSTPTYTGHSFLGWYTAQSGGTRITSITATTSSPSKEAYAHWSTNSYTISTSVSPSGAGTVSGGGSKYYGTSVSLTASANSGYEFNYWYDNDTGTTYSSNPYSFTCTEDRSLTAVFRSTSYSYTITYYPNGGTGSSITDTVTGSSSTFNTYLRGLTYTKAYNTQTGWHESDDTPHGLGDLISISHDMTLYATWTHDTTSYFYWFGNDTLDGQKIFTGTSITNLTAIAWKSIGTKINQVEALLGDTQTQFTTTMTSGSVFRATYYNEVTQALRRIINSHSLNISAPSDTAKGNRLFYYLFNGAASVKACLNNIIQWYNTR